MSSKKMRAFTLMELIAVVIIVLVMMGTTALTLYNSSQSVRLRKDASQTIAFMRNMWDRSRTSGSALILWPDFASGELSYTEPRTGKREKASFSSKAKVVAVKINDRVHSASSGYEPVEEEGEFYQEEMLYLSEGRGLTQLAVVFGVPKDEAFPEAGFKHLAMASINLITGRGQTRLLDQHELDGFLEQGGGHESF